MCEKIEYRAEFTSRHTDWIDMETELFTQGHARSLLQAAAPWLPEDSPEREAVEMVASFLGAVGNEPTVARSGELFEQLRGER